MAWTPSYLITLLGYTALAYLCVHIGSFVYLYFLHSSKLPKYQHGTSTGSQDQHRAWALVTGASDGIGKGFAQELCSKGFNVVLHGRNQSKLERVKTELKKDWPQIETKIVTLDAQHADGQAIDRFVAGLKDLNITILVNNVGGADMISPLWRTVESLGLDDIDAVISVNASFMTRLTAKMLPSLRSHKPALIINLSSITADVPSAYLAVYAATKGYVQSFSRSLASELKAEQAGVEVLSLIVAETQAQHNPGPTNFTRPTARRLAADTLRVVGCGRTVVTPYIGHRIIEQIMQLLPQWVFEAVVIKAAKTYMAAYNKET